MARLNLRYSSFLKFFMSKKTVSSLIFSTQLLCPFRIQYNVRGRYTSSNLSYFKMLSEAEHWALIIISSITCKDSLFTRFICKILQYFFRYFRIFCSRFKYAMDFKELFSIDLLLFVYFVQVVSQLSRDGVAGKFSSQTLYDLTC